MTAPANTQPTMASVAVPVSGRALCSAMNHAVPRSTRSVTKKTHIGNLEEAGSEEFMGRQLAPESRGRPSPSIAPLATRATADKQRATRSGEPFVRRRGVRHKGKGETFAQSVVPVDS